MSSFPKSQKNNNQKYFLMAGLTFGLLGVLFIFSFFTNKTEADELYVESFQNKYAVFALDLPNEMNFADETVPLKNFDVRESLDRELLVNTYWQSQTLLLFKRANRYFPIIEKILKEQGIPDDFKFLALAESGFINVVSPLNATGFWQFLEGTAKDYGLEVNSEIDERYHLEKSTIAACKYFKESYKRYGSWTTVAASYNAGRAFMDRQIDRQKTNSYYDLLLGEETGRYVFRILSLKEILGNPKKYGFYLRIKDLYPPLKTTEVIINGPVEDLAAFAMMHHTNYKLLKKLNPWLRENYITNKNGKIYTIQLLEPGFRENSFDTDSVFGGDNEQINQGIEPGGSETSD